MKFVFGSINAIFEHVSSRFKRQGNIIKKLKLSSFSLYEIVQSFLFDQNYFQNIYIKCECCLIAERRLAINVILKVIVDNRLLCYELQQEFLIPSQLRIKGVYCVVRAQHQHNTSAHGDDTAHLEGVYGFSS